MGYWGRIVTWNRSQILYILDWVLCNIAFCKCPESNLVIILKSKYMLWCIMDTHILIRIIVSERDRWLLSVVFFFLDIDTRNEPQSQQGHHSLIQFGEILCVWSTSVAFTLQGLSHPLLVILPIFPNETSPLYNKLHQMAVACMFQMWGDAHFMDTLCLQKTDFNDALNSEKMKRYHLVV